MRCSEPGHRAQVASSVLVVRVAELGSFCLHTQRLSRQHIKKVGEWTTYNKSGGVKQQKTFKP